MRAQEEQNEMDNISDEGGNDTIRAAERPGKLRQRILIGALVAACILWGAAQFEQRSLRADAASLAEAALAEHREPGVDTVSRLVVAREWPFFGTPVAKVEVFRRDADLGPDGPIGGVEYEYAYLNGQWELRNSGVCTSEACVTRGREAFGL